MYKNVLLITVIQFLIERMEIGNENNKKGLSYKTRHFLIYAQFVIPGTKAYSY